MFFFSFFYCQVGDGGFTSKESPPSESSDSSMELSVSASGFRGMGGGKAKGQGHGRWGLGLFICGRTGGIGIYMAKWAIHSHWKLGLEGMMHLDKGWGHKSWPTPSPQHSPLKIFLSQSFPV